MAIYMVRRTTQVHFDQYSSFIVSAPTPERAIEICLAKIGEAFFDWGDYEPEEEYQRESLTRVKNEEEEYRRGFREAIVTRLDEETEDGIVLGSYHAG